MTVRVAIRLNVQLIMFQIFRNDILQVRVLIVRVEN